eukprot:3859745-Amphidinium_carterae.1
MANGSIQLVIFTNVSGFGQEKQKSDLSPVACRLRLFCRNFTQDDCVVSRAELPWLNLPLYCVDQIRAKSLRISNVRRYSRTQTCAAVPTCSLTRSVSLVNAFSTDAKAASLPCSS